MALRTDIKQEKVALDTIVKRSVLGRHINETILRPILDSIEYESKIILDDLGFMIVSEIQHRLATAPNGFTYEVWEVFPGAERGEKYHFVGHYTASAFQGPPMSGGQTGSGIPTGSLYESIWYGVNSEGSLSVTIDSPEGGEKVWKVIRNKEGKMVSNKIFIGFDDSQALPVGSYFQILNNLDGSRPNWWGNIIDKKRKYWYNWMTGRFQKAVKEARGRRWSVPRALKLNIYWKTT